MKDHYTLLHNFLEKHFPAQLPKLEAIKDKPVEVIMMYNMYKRSAKNALKERMESSKEVNEAKATCCHRCGRVHVKGSGCKRPYLKGKDSCAINEIETLKEFFNK